MKEFQPIFGVLTCFKEVLARPRKVLTHFLSPIIIQRSLSTYQPPRKLAAGVIHIKCQREKNLKWLYASPIIDFVFILTRLLLVSYAFSTRPNAIINISRKSNSLISLQGGGERRLRAECVKPPNLAIFPPKVAINSCGW